MPHLRQPDAGTGSAEAGTWPTGTGTGAGPGGRRGDLPPRSLDEIQQALNAIPRRVSKTKGPYAYPYHQQVLAGLRSACERLHPGQGHAMAIDLMEQHSPSAACSWDVEQVLSSSLNLDEGVFWGAAKAEGWDPRLDGTKRKEARQANGVIPPYLAATATRGGGEGDAEQQAEDAAAVSHIQRQGAVTLALHDIFPPGLAEALTTRAAAFPADPNCLLLPTIATVASIVGNRIEIEVKKGWTEPFVIWAAIVIRASKLKSPIISVIRKALIAWQTELRDKRKNEIAAWKRERNAFIQKGSETGGNLSNEQKEAWDAENPCPVPYRHVYVEDATLEQIGRITASDEYRGLISFFDELLSWFTQLQRGKAAQDQRSNWLSLWPGSALKIDRVSADPLFVPHTAHSVCGPLTLSGFADLLASKSGADDKDGMSARFLLWLLKNPVWSFNEIEADITPLLLDLFRDKIDAKIPERLKEGSAHKLTFDRDARAALMAFGETMAHDAEHHSSEDRAVWLDKMRGYSVRLAGVLHVINQASRELPILASINLDTVEKTIKLSRALIAQYDTIHAEIGGSTAGLPSDVARLVAKGADWRKEHGNAAVPLAQVRDWSLPDRTASAAARRAWLEDVAVRFPSAGQIVRTAKSISWLPAAPREG